MYSYSVRKARAEPIVHYNHFHLELLLHHLQQSPSPQVFAPFAHEYGHHHSAHYHHAHYHTAQYHTAHYHPATTDEANLQVYPTATTDEANLQVSPAESNCINHYKIQKVKKFTQYNK